MGLKSETNHYQWDRFSFGTIIIPLQEANWKILKWTMHLRCKFFDWEEDESNLTCKFGGHRVLYFKPSGLETPSEKTENEGLMQTWKKTYVNQIICRNLTTFDRDLGSRSQNCSYGKTLVVDRDETMLLYFLWKIG